MMYPESLDGLDVKSPAEKILFSSFQQQLSDQFTVLFSVSWIDIRRNGKKPSDGEIDFVIIHPRMGILVLEVKGGLIGCDEQGNWISVRKDGSQVDIKDPFEQAKANKYALLNKIDGLPNWQHKKLTIGHAVAFPDGALDNLYLGPNIPDEIILLHTDLDDLDGWMRRCLKFWAGENFFPPGEQGLESIKNLLRKSWYLREPKIGEEIGPESKAIMKYTREQFRLLDWLSGHPRAAIKGCAGSGKTLLALEKAKRLADEGFRTLLTCYNRNLAEELKSVAGRRAHLKVINFHSLCKEYAARSGRDQQPDWHEKNPDFFKSIMPDALAEAASLDPDQYCFDAIIVDEGQDFEESWWTALEMLLADFQNGVFYIFFDDNQLVYKHRLTLPLQEAPFQLTINCRNTKRIHEALIKFYRSQRKPECNGPEGRNIGVNMYGDPPYDLSAKLTEVIARLVYDQNIPASDIVILSSGGIERPPFSKIKKAGAFQLVPSSSKTTEEIFCTSIRLFKGLESPVIILVPPDEDDQLFSELIYVGISRAKNHIEIMINENTNSFLKGMFS